MTKQSEAYDTSAWMSEVHSAIKYVSIEPLQEEISDHILGLLFDVIDWVIVGAQTNPLKLPSGSWVEDIIDVAESHRIPVFLKNNLQPLFPGVKLRREFPDAASAYE